MGQSDSWPIGLIDKSDIGASHELINRLESVHSELAPYFKVMETDPEKAQKAVEKGRLHIVITILEDFQDTNKVYTETYHINTDMMKNVKLRLEYGLLKEMDNRGETELLTEKPFVVPRSAFFAGSAFLLSLMLSTTIVAANLFLNEKIERVRKFC